MTIVYMKKVEIQVPKVARKVEIGGNSVEIRYQINEKLADCLLLVTLSLVSLSLIRRGDCGVRSITNLFERG